jgi:hypothetical protein
MVVFGIIFQKPFVKKKKSVSLHRFRNKAQRLSHGVMVALQFLVLPDQVRVLVRQQNLNG